MAAVQSRMQAMGVAIEAAYGVGLRLPVTSYVKICNNSN